VTYRPIDARDQAKLLAHGVKAANLAPAGRRRAPPQSGSPQGGGFNRRASSAEAKANKGKQKEAKRLPFISFYFLLFPRIGTFQWVMGEGNKKIRPLSSLALKLRPTMSNSHAPRTARPPAKRVNSDNMNIRIPLF